MIHYKEALNPVYIPLPITFKATVGWQCWNCSAIVRRICSSKLVLLPIQYSLSLRFNGRFPGEPGLAGVYWSKGWWRWWWQLDYWSYKSWKAPVKSSSPTNQYPVFYRPDALLVAQPTVSKHRRYSCHKVQFKFGTAANWTLSKTSPTYYASDVEDRRQVCCNGRTKMSCTQKQSASKSRTKQNI